MLSNGFTLHHVMHSATLLEEILRERMDALGIRHRQARVIDALSRMEPASQAALAREFDVTPASMSTMTARLIDAGYVSREDHPAEARSYLLRLTDRGRGLLSDIHATWHEMDALIAERLGAEDTRTLSRIARDLRDRLGGHVPGTPRSNTRQDDVAEAKVTAITSRIGANATDVT